jgi:hypothetical protein
MEKATDISTKPLMPVFNTSGCVGHILCTARGLQVTGTLPTADAAAVALLERATS